ncbi:hypothetical protein Tco_1318953, partial [Tanacetum coccineum]
VRVDDGLYELGFVEDEFPAIVIDDTVKPQDALPCKFQVSTPGNNEIDFRISFDESDDEDYTIIYDINSFSYKMISVNNLKTNSENDNEKAVSEYDEEEQNILYFNDIFPFNIIRPDDLKSGKDKNDNDVAIIHSSKDMALPPCEQRHRFLRYEGLVYTDSDIAYFESRENHRSNIGWRIDVPVERLIMGKNEEMGHDMAPLPPREQRHPLLRYQGLEYTNEDIVDFEERMRMEHRDDAGVVVFTGRAWGRLFDTRGPLVRELILEFLNMLRFGEVLLDFDAPRLHTEEEMESHVFARYWSESERMIPGKGDLHDYWRDISTDGDFLGPPPSYTLIRDPVLRLYHRMMAHSIARRSQAARYLRRFAIGRKSGAHISGGQFVARLAEHFGLLTAEILGGLTVIAPELSIIDMAELDTPAIDEGDQAVLAHVQAPMQAPQQPPQPPPPFARSVP